MSTTQRPQSSSDRSQTFLDWVQLNQRWVTVGAAVIVVGAAAFWFIQKQSQSREEQASRALLTAKSSLASNNEALAQTDLQTVVNRWPNTSAGVEAAMTLATLDYDKGKYQDGINLLEKEAKQGRADVSLTSLYGLIGDGYAQLKKMPDAAKAYERAAANAASRNAKGEAAYQKSKAARTYVAAGDTAAGRRLWTELMNGDVQAVAAEARVRVGELSAFSTPRS